jgi:hypothetical protein
MGFLNIVRALSCAGMGFLIGLCLLDMVFDVNYHSNPTQNNLDILISYYQSNIPKAGIWGHVIKGIMAIAILSFIISVATDHNTLRKIILIVLISVAGYTFLDISKA